MGQNPGEGQNSRQWKSKIQSPAEINIKWLKQPPMLKPEKLDETLLQKNSRQILGNFS